RKAVRAWTARTCATWPGTGPWAPPSRLAARHRLGHPLRRGGRRGRFVAGRRGPPSHRPARQRQVTPKQLVQEWVRRFNEGDAEGLASLYADDAVNHQVVMEPLHGRAAIRGMFEVEFGRAAMTCLVEHLFEDGEWAILEWRDPG